MPAIDWHSWEEQHQEEVEDLDIITLEKVGRGLFRLYFQIYSEIIVLSRGSTDLRILKEWIKLMVMAGAIAHVEKQKANTF